MRRGLHTKERKMRHSITERRIFKMLRTRFDNETAFCYTDTQERYSPLPEMGSGESAFLTIFLTITRDKTDKHTTIRSEQKQQQRKQI